MESKRMVFDWKSIVWSQYGACIEMLENVMDACPDGLWFDRSKQPEFWYLVYHTLFWLDAYLSESPDTFMPPHPFNLDEMDPAGLLPERPYTKEEMRAYLEQGRDKCRAHIVALTNEQAAEQCGWERVNVNRGELLLYHMRHVQHHTAQLNLMLRHTIDSAPRWVTKSKQGLTD